MEGAVSSAERCATEVFEALRGVPQQEGDRIDPFEYSSAQDNGGYSWNTLLVTAIVAAIVAYGILQGHD